MLDVHGRRADAKALTHLPRQRHIDEPVEISLPSARTDHPDFAGRVLQVAERVAISSLVLLSVCAALSARFGGSLPVKPLPLAGWGFGSAVCAIALAALATDPEVNGVGNPIKRRIFGVLLMLALLGCGCGIVASADGVAGPAWVMFVPMVVVAGAVLGPSLGLLVGAGASGSLYAAAGLSHTLTAAGLGRLVVLLPALPALGWAAGGLAGAAHAAAADARRQRQALESDVAVLTSLLEIVADGDLSTVPSLDKPAAPATGDLAVVFSDTLLALRRLVRQLAGVAEQLAVSSTQLATSATDHVGAVEEQASAVAQTTSTIEQLAATATTIAETSVRVSKYAGSTRHDVEAGTSAVHEATAAMTGIGERVDELTRRTSSLSNRVDQIALAARHIDELGRQTTMLSVNAAIEAARVGEKGAGFANVAAEVGQLAARARAATGRISVIVNDLHAEVAATAAVNAEGVAAIRVGLERQKAVDAALAKISDMVDQTTVASRDITLATRQQRTASDAVVAAMTTVMGASDRARDATQGHARSAQRLRVLAETVRASVGRFRIS